MCVEGRVNQQNGVRSGCLQFRKNLCEPLWLGIVVILNNQEQLSLGGQLFREILVDAAAPMGRLVLGIIERRWTSMSIFEKS
jgi:hypothetical protein